MVIKLDSNKLKIGLRKELIKDETIVDSNSLESAIKKIHAADEKEKKTSIKSTKRITLDIEKTLHKRISLYTLENEMSIKDFFLSLAIEKMKDE